MDGDMPKIKYCISICHFVTCTPNIWLCHLMHLLMMLVLDYMSNSGIKIDI